MRTLAVHCHHEHIFSCIADRRCSCTRDKHYATGTQAHVALLSCFTLQVVQWQLAPLGMAQYHNRATGQRSPDHQVGAAWLLAELLSSYVCCRRHTCQHARLQLAALSMLRDAKSWVRQVFVKWVITDGMDVLFTALVCCRWLHGDSTRAKKP